MEGMCRKLIAQVEYYFYYSYRSFYSFGFFCYPYSRLSVSKSL